MATSNSSKGVLTPMAYAFSSGTSSAGITYTVFTSDTTNSMKVGSYYHINSGNEIDLGDVFIIQDGHDPVDTSIDHILIKNLPFPTEQKMIHIVNPLSVALCLEFSSPDYGYFRYTFCSESTTIISSNLIYTDQIQDPYFIISSVAGDTNNSYALSRMTSNDVKIPNNSTILSSDKVPTREGQTLIGTGVNSPNMNSASMSHPLSVSRMSEINTHVTQLIDASSTASLTTDGNAYDFANLANGYTLESDSFSMLEVDLSIVKGDVGSTAYFVKKIIKIGINSNFVRIIADNTTMNEFSGISGFSNANISYSIDSNSCLLISINNTTTASLKCGAVIREIKLFPYW